MVKQAHDQAATATLERRSEPRIKAGHSVLLRAPNAHPMEACLLDISSQGARLRIPDPVSVGETVRIEAPDLLLAGTINRCELTRGAYEVGLALSFPMEMFGELRKLNAALLSESKTTFGGR